MSLKPPYMLEVQKYIEDAHAKKLNGRFKHVGYIKKLFRSKREACEYYDMHNPHMRSLNAHRTYKSDWDPETKLRYLVRKCWGECRRLHGFDA
jgi:hypothetical protein